MCTCITVALMDELLVGEREELEVASLEFLNDHGYLELLEKQCFAYRRRSNEASPHRTVRPGIAVG